MASPITTSQPLPASTVGSGRSTESQPVTATGTSSQARQPVAVGGNSPPAPAATQQQGPSAQELAQATRDISDYIQTVSRSLQISVDADLGSTVIQVLDAETDEIVRQIPSEEVLQIARFLAEQQAGSEGSDVLKGLLMDQEG
jgi:flagellar protein FlaG